MVKALVLLSTFLLLCAAHERPEVSKQQEAIARLGAEMEAHAGAKEYAAAAGKQEELEAATAALGEVTRLEGELATLAEAKKYAAAAAKQEELEAVVAALASGTTCGAGTMEAAVAAARKLADDGERKAILGALEKIGTGETELKCVRRKRCRLPAHPPTAAGAAPSLPAPRRQPLPRSLTHTYSLAPARPPRPPHTAARRAA
jgi:hypothetical protein